MLTGEGILPKKGPMTMWPTSSQLTLPPTPPYYLSPTGVIIYSKDPTSSSFTSISSTTTNHHIPSNTTSRTLSSPSHFVKAYAQFITLPYIITNVKITAIAQYYNHAAFSRAREDMKLPNWDQCEITTRSWDWASF